MKFIHYTWLISLITVQNFAMDSKTSSVLATIDEAPRYYAGLVETLFKQPLFDGYSPVPQVHTVLPLEDLNDCRISTILHENIDGSKWSLRSLHRNSHVVSSSGQSINRGLEVSLRDHQGIQYSPQDLAKIYGTIIATIQNNWSVSTLDKNPDIVHKKSEATWILFIKKSDVIHEDSCIRFLAKKFNLENIMICDNQWHDQSGSLEYRDTMYLWVNKANLKKVKSILKFNLC